MPDKAHTVRDVTADDLAWIGEQAKEVQVLKVAQMLRDGHLYDNVLNKVVEKVKLTQTRRAKVGA